ncbi:hypothetical protein GCM10027612_35560 [Microbispora bryophytorum subsp. camponoti]
MTWFITDKPELFRSEAGPFLAARPDLHTMLLSGLDTIEQLRSGVNLRPRCWAGGGKRMKQRRRPRSCGCHRTC